MDGFCPGSRAISVTGGRGAQWMALSQIGSQLHLVYTRFYPWPITLSDLH